MLPAAALFAVAGAVVLLATESTTATAVAIGLFGVAGVLAISAAFYAVGRSEDEARAAERARRPR